MTACQPGWFSPRFLISEDAFSGFEPGFLKFPNSLLADGRGAVRVRRKQQLRSVAGARHHRFGSEGVEGLRRKLAKGR